MSLDMNNRVAPLVSILIYNYNYGKYLGECLESIFNQTYPNVEVTFSDNASDDDSWKIALEYLEKYPDRMTVTRNRVNFGINDNFLNCFMGSKGKYYVNMCSDDILAPNYVEKCVKVLESSPSSAFVMTHRAILDGKGNIHDEAPFYSQSCIIKGEEQAAVYMMAAVNPSVSQIMYRRDNVHYNDYLNTVLAGRWYATRVIDFRLCLKYDIAYLKAPLLIHRIHGDNDSLGAVDNLMEVIGPYVLNLQFADFSKPYNMTKVQDRLTPSIEKLSTLSLRYCVKSLLENNRTTALKYFYLSVVMNPEIFKDDLYLSIQGYLSCSDDEKQKLLDELKSKDNLVARSVSYAPPPNSVGIEV